MTKTAIIRKTGGPEVIEFEDVALPAPAAGEVRIRHTAIGVNFIDTYHRNGLYPLPLPAHLGVEAAGVVEAVGSGVSSFRVGDPVCYFGGGGGSYSEARNLAAEVLFAIPAGLAADTVAASLLKGCTAECLIERCAKVQPGQTVLVHAAAGGVGLILVQWLKAIGATVIGTVGSEEKAALARASGADHVILYRKEDTAKKVHEWTGGKGVPVVFDGVGMATWQSSLDSTAQRGLIVSYGNASGPVTGVGLGVLAQHGSLFVTRPLLFHYYTEAAERRAGIGRLFSMLKSGKVKITIGQRFPLQEAAAAHRALEARQTSGSTLLVPQGRA